ncbi:class I SAM-dependent methyltransferase [Bacillus sp. EB600]|uniref:class I SAM-dependent methyltransferase n=1 Tax=Bacillus sp. EB600 TaxID=2806345 RepID=UPI00210F1099|nr:class I SAM-dependent methyltransferase [Bacillus sp. EB600]MCQ6277831.1 class I SAM-dependent methyltransferase [Bacillus sp. EB600]
MFVTTAGRTNQEMIKKAREMAGNLKVDYIPRNKKSIHYLQMQANSECMVVGKERIELFGKGESQPFFFHPNSAMFRIKRLMKREHDPFVDAACLIEGTSFLDCTLGLASDSIVASYLVGESGSVTGVEGQPFLAFIVKSGLSTWDSGLSAMDEAMRRIIVVNENALNYLRRLPSESIDCVYFDPMFEESILESDGIKALGHFAIHEDLQEETIREAIRVSRQRVVLKDQYKSGRFQKFGFRVMRRKTAKFHYGWIEKN